MIEHPIVLGVTSHFLGEFRVKLVDLRCTYAPLWLMLTGT